MSDFYATAPSILDFYAGIAPGLGGFYVGFDAIDDFYVDVVTSPSLQTVVQVDPADGEFYVILHQRVHVTFFEPLDPDTVSGDTAQIKLVGVPIPALVIWRPGPQTITIRPLSLLLENTTYAVRVVGGPDGVKDNAGEWMESNFDSTFTTGTEVGVTES